HGWAAKSLPSASSCASCATRPAPNAGPHAVRSPWHRAWCRCWPGWCTSGRAPNWPWPSMRRRWAHVLPSWRSGWCIGAVPSRCPGPSWPPPPHMPGAGSGCACCGRCAGRFPGRGPSSSSPVGASTPPACFDGHSGGVRVLRQERRALPRSWTVIVLADRGLYARWLFRRITRLGWHPFLRINTGGTFRPHGHVRRVPRRTLVRERGTAWQGTGIAFTGRHRQLHCTLLACWEAGYKDPWLILTDLPPEASTACWYGLRAWIEQGFKITKRAGWQWQRTHMTKPDRAARLWLAVAVATLWLLSVGGEAEETIPVSTVP